MFLCACAFSASPYMQTYLSLRNDARVYVYMSAYADFTRELMYVGSGNNFVTFGAPYG